MKSRALRRIVTIGGGTGTFTVLSALKPYPVELSAIVTMSDDGGSTGKLRDEYGVLPPGDIRRALIALSEDDGNLRELFAYRFENGGLEGHNFGNIFLTALEKLTGSFAEAVKTASRVLRVHGQVIPVTLDNVRLQAELANGDIISGETNIDIPKHDAALAIKRIFLKGDDAPRARAKAVTANPDAIQAIRSAQMVIIGPGDLYTSILPNMLVPGIVDALRNTKATIVYICNCMTKYGETTGFTAADFLARMEAYVGTDVIDVMLVNNRKPSAKRLAEYAAEHAEPVVIPANFSWKGIKRADLITEHGLIRHDPEKLARVLMKLV